MTIEAGKEDRLSHLIIGAAIEVHRALGPGLLESAYEAALSHELAQRGARFARQVPVPVEYKGVRLDCGFRLDLLVEDKVVIELKAVDAFAPIHQVQMLTYLKLTGLKLGILLNFNVKKMQDGVRRVVLNL